MRTVGAALVLLLASCTGVEEPIPLLLGVLADPAEVEAVRLAVEQTNRAGGVNGHPVELVVEGEGGRLREAGAAAVVAGSLATDEVLAELAGAGVVVVASRSLPSELVELEGVLSLAPLEAAQGAVLAELVEEDEVALLFHPGTRTAAEAFLASFDARPFLLEEDLPLAELAELDAEAVVCLCLSDRAPTLLVAAFRHGLMGRPWYYGDSMHDPRLPGRVFPQDPGRLAGQRGVALDSSTPPGFDRFAAAYREQREADPGSAEARAYDAALLVILAAEAGEVSARRLAAVSRGGEPCLSVECLQLVREGRDLDYVGASGPTDLSERGHLAETTVVVWRYTLDGGIEELERRTYRP